MDVIIGHITAIYPTQQKAAKTGQAYTIRQFDVDASYVDQYGKPVPNHFRLDVFGNQCVALDALAVGNRVAVKVIVKGERFAGKDGLTHYAVKLKTIGIVPEQVYLTGQQPAQPAQPTQMQPQQFAPMPPHPQYPPQGPYNNNGCL